VIARAIAISLLAQRVSSNKNCSDNAQGYPSLAQDCAATARSFLLIAQVNIAEAQVNILAGAQVYKRKWNLVRSRLGDESFRYSLPLLLVFQAY